MMNLVALSLVVSSLTIAGVWSPSPEIYPKDVIVKEGHKVIVVQYDYDGQTNTKVSLKPEHKQDVDDPADKTKEIKTNGGNRHHYTPRELICDAVGKCTHRLASAIGKTKDKVAETTHRGIDQKKEIAHKAAKDAAEKAHEAVEEMKEIVREAKEAVECSYERLKDKAAQKAHDVKETAGKAAEDVKETAHNVKESAAKKAQDVKESAKESVDKAKDTLKTTKDTGKTMVEDMAMNATEQMESTKQSTKHFIHKVKSCALELVGGITHFVGNTVRYMNSPEALNDFVVVLNLLGFATAYGMCVWVIFVSSYVLAGALPRQQFGIVQSKIYPVYFRIMAFSIMAALLGHVLGQRRKIFTKRAEILQWYNLLASVLMVFTNMLVFEPRATKAMFERMKLEKEEGRGLESYEGEGGRVTESEPERVSDPAGTATTTTTTGGAPTTETPSRASERSQVRERSMRAPERSHTRERSSEQEAVRSRIARQGQRLKKLNSCSSFLNIMTLMALSWHLVYLGQRLLLNC